MDILVTSDMETFKRHMSNVLDLRSIAGALEWDALVMMPKESMKARGQQLAALKRVINETQVSEKARELLETVERDVDSLDEWQRANVRLCRKRFDLESTKTPGWIEETEQLKTSMMAAWERARAEDDGSTFLPLLGRMIELQKQLAGLNNCSEDPYSFCIDEYEVGMTKTRIDSIFAAIKPELVSMVSRLRTLPALEFPAVLLEGPFDVEGQISLNKEVAAKLGFDFSKGRLDVSTHPFTMGIHPSDVRITSRYNTADFISGLSGTVHETGHAIYELQRNMEHDRELVNEPLSMAVHESQSLFFERMIALSLPFWKWVAPLVHKHLPITKEVTAKQMWRCANRVDFDNFIRVNADELTYPLHIMLRFELEKAMLDGLESGKIEGEWNRLMEELLSLKVPKASLGYLQDVHWAMGSYGYFPSYTLGAIFAAQWHAQLSKSLNIDTLVEQGDFAPVRQGLRELVHQWGSLDKSADALSSRVSGAPVQPEVFLSYLKKKYSQLFETDL